jgi:uncharacterized membrane protein YhdT
MEDLNPDERFIQCKKETIITFCMLVVHILLLLLIFYQLGGDCQNYTYVLGFPLHIFLMVIEIALFIATVFVVLDKVFRHMDLDPIGKLHPRE